MKGEYGTYDNWANLAAKKAKRVDPKANPQAGDNTQFWNKLQIWNNNLETETSTATNLFLMSYRLGYSRQDKKLRKLSLFIATKVDDVDRCLARGADLLESIEALLKYRATRFFAVMMICEVRHVKGQAASSRQRWAKRSQDTLKICFFLSKCRFLSLVPWEINRRNHGHDEGHVRRRR